MAQKVAFYFLSPFDLPRVGCFFPRPILFEDLEELAYPNFFESELYLVCVFKVENVTEIFE